MLCRKPYSGGPLPVGCGQCIPCKINRRRLWCTRQILESYLHDASTFVTLTYAEENLPRALSLSPADLRGFFKRLRQYTPIKLRYYAVGEYGDQSNRPHYHASIFGLSIAEAHLVEKAWSKDKKSIGHVLVGEFNQHTAAYVTGYITKGLTKKDDPRLNDRHREFCRMSNRPGLGAGAMEITANQLHKIGTQEDVPHQIRINGKLCPLGPYLIGKFRKHYGLTETQIENLKTLYLLDRDTQLSEMLQAAIADTPKEAHTKGKLASAEHAGKMTSMEALEKIFNSKDKL